MRLGLDFDNTLVSYDRAFHAAALDRGWIPASLAPGKVEVKQFLLAQGRNDDWTELQGFVYGPGMAQAHWFDRFPDFLEQVLGAGWEVFVVSHRTRYPYLGPPYDLHLSALEWLDRSGIFSDLGLSRNQVFFNETKEEKVSKIKDLVLNAFVDDLPEILGHPDFPKSTCKFLFDPGNFHVGNGLNRIHHWSKAFTELAKVGV